MKQVLQDFESARSIPQAISEDNLKQRVSAPDWIDLNLARRGQKFARGNILAISISHSYGLTTMPHPDLVNVLLFTGRSSSPESAAKRYYSTTTEILSWYDELPWGSGPGGGEFAEVAKRYLQTKQTYLFKFIYS